ncbi:42194_t:CDS:2, partial [Gigaspora margarita]
MSQNKDKLVIVEDETLSSTNSDVKQIQKTGQANFETNFGCLFMDLLSEAKKRCRLDGLDNLEKEKKIELDKDSKPASNYNSSKFNFEAFSNEFGGVPSDDMGSRLKTSSNFIPPRMHAAMNKMPSSCGFQEGIWKKPLLSGDVKYVYLARQ